MYLIMRNNQILLFKGNIKKLQNGEEIFTKKTPLRFEVTL